MAWIQARALIAAATLLSGVAVSATAPADVIAFVDVTVVPMSRNELRPHQTVVVEGGKIVAMGSTESIRVPHGARLIPGAGHYLLPGLIDMHTHFTRRPTDADAETWRFPDYQERNEDFALLYVANGVTSVRQMHGHPAGDELIAGIAKNGWLGPAIFSTGPITDGDPPEWPIARIVRTPGDAARAVEQDKAAGYIGIKVYDALSLQNYDAIVAAAAKARLDVVGHIPDEVGLGRAIAANQWTIEHTDSFLLSLQPGEGPYTIPAADIRWAELERRADLSKLPGYADAMRRAGIWTCPTIVVNQMYADTNAWSSEMRYVPYEFAAKWIEHYSGSTHDFAQDLRFSLAVVSGLHSRGAGLLLGTDAFKLNVVAGFSALHELEYFVRAGLTPYEALETGTSNAARALHLENTLGTIDVGKQADLILLDANPLSDVRNVAQRSGVMLRGRWLPESELQQRLATVAQRVLSRVGAATPPLTLG